MGAYKGVVRHVRYWRGKVHRWSTTHTFIGTLNDPIDSTDCQNLLLLDDAMCYNAETVDGGTYACDFYDLSTGGVPIAAYTRFDWATPGSWIGYGGGGWHPGSADLVSGAETALVVEYPAGLSKTGKPVTIKNWYHAVPVSAPVGGAPDVSAADLLTLAAKAGEIKGVLGSKGLVLGSKSGRIAGDPRVLAYYGNHQMPKGRRKKRTATGALTDLQLAELLVRELAGPSVPPLF